MATIFSIEQSKRILDVISKGVVPYMKVPDAMLDLLEDVVESVRGYDYKVASVIRWWVNDRRAGRTPAQSQIEDLREQVALL